MTNIRVQDILKANQTLAEQADNQDALTENQGQGEIQQEDVSAEAESVSAGVEAVSPDDQKEIYNATMDEVA